MVRFHPLAFCDPASGGVRCAASGLYGDVPDLPKGSSRVTIVNSGETRDRRVPARQCDATDQRMDALEITDAIARCRSVRLAAKSLGTSLTNLRYWIRKHGLQHLVRNRGVPPDRQLFLSAVASSDSIAGVIRKIGMAYTGSAYSLVRRYVNEYGAGTSHWKGQRHGRTNTATPLDKVLVENGEYRVGKRKTRLINLGLLKNECEVCGLSPEWRGQKLTLILDHKNGIRNDNRLTNLRLVCGFAYKP